MPACGSCAAPDAPSLCSACKFAAYCGPPCQRAAWAGHKAVCKAIQADAAAAPKGDDPGKTHCDGCAKQLCGVNKACTRCRSVSYCSAACQAAHWRASHKAVCQGVGEARFARLMVHAVAGDAVAMHSIGICYDHGTGVARDEREMAVWWRRAAEKGIIEAQFNLACCYRDGAGVEKDVRTAVEWYRRAAVAGFAKAQNYLGLFYFAGKGVEKDEKAAFEWFYRAALAGHDDAQNSLGHCYFNGAGVEMNARVAVEWYRRAAATGHAGAQYNLGDLYERGDSVEADSREAIKWYRRAAGAVGSPAGAVEARSALARLGVETP